MDVLTDGSVTATNVPADLTAVFTRTSDTVVTLTLTGTAAAHGHADDVSNLTITFIDTAFAMEDAATIADSTYTTGVIDFNDASLVYAGSFTEATANDGSVTGSITATLKDDTFADDVVTRGYVTATNVPDGLIVAFIRTSPTVVTLTLTGTANAHTDDDDVNNLTIEFTDDAFVTGSVATVLNPTSTTGEIEIEIDFHDASTLAYAGTFTESTANDGTVTGSSITATLTGDTFDADVLTDGSVTATNVPAGLTAEFTRTSPTVVTLTLTGNAIAHEDSNDVSDLTITFEDTAFALGSAVNIAASTYTTATIDFRDASTLTYAGSFTETAANDGTVTGSITATLDGDTFAAEGVITNGSSVAVTSTTLPTGLTAVFTRTSDTVVTLMLTGTAGDRNAVSDLTITFSDDAFAQENADTIAASTYTDGVIDFNTASLTYAGSFTEAAANDGTVTGSITATLVGDTFNGNNDDILASTVVTATNVPTGLTAVFTRTSDTVVTLTLTGTADDHLHVNDEDDLTITFTDDAFAALNGVVTVDNLISSGHVIDFRNASVLTYAGSFTESDANDGSVTGSIIAMLEGDTFNGTNGDILGSAVVSVSSGLPPGLTAVFTRTSDKVVTLTLDGNATAHEDGNDEDSLTINFTDDAFAQEIADTITDSTYATGKIDFNTASLTYAGSFTEADANDGMVTSDITATLVGDTFAQAVDATTTYVTFTGLPPSLTPVLTRTSDRIVTLTLDGSITPHEAINTVSGLTITFAAAAFFTATDVATVVNSAYTTTIDFRDASTLTYEGGFTESTTNDGSVTGSITATLVGDTFNGTNGDILGTTFVEADNVPDNLTAVFTRTSDTVVTLTLTGTADAHLHVNDVDDLTITFTDDAFVQENVATIATSTYTAGVIDFSEAFLTYADSFTEGDLNDGTVTGSITATLTGDNFAADVVTSNYVSATTIPDGLIAVFTLDSTNNMVTLTFTGMATTHTAAVDNLTITFADAAFKTDTVTAATVANSAYTTTIDFRDASTLVYAGSFTESAANDGSVTGSITATLTGDTFAAENVITDDSDSSVTATVPAGLTAVFARTSDTVVTLTLTGQANDHHSGINGTDAGGVLITFTDSAFTLENTSTTIEPLTSDTDITFRDESILTYAGSFTETDVNDGTVTGSITATLSGDTFAADVVTRNYVSATTIPDGLTAVFTRTSDTVVTLTLTGTATAHSKSNVADLTIEFTADAFVVESASTIVYTTTINFNDDALTFGAETIANQPYKVGKADNIILPRATGGALPLSYSLTGSIPEGLTFTPADRVLAGTPTSVATAAILTYTVTDNAMLSGERMTAALNFMVSVTKGDQSMDFMFPGKMQISTANDGGFTVPVRGGSGTGAVTYKSSNDNIASVIHCCSRY